MKNIIIEGLAYVGAFLVGWVLGYSAVTVAFGCEFDDQIRAEAVRAGVPAETATLLCHAESSGNPWAVGPGGERGLFQLTPGTWRIVSQEPFSRAFDPGANIVAGVAYLAQARSSEPKILASWMNAGRRDWWNLPYRSRQGHPNRIYRAIYKEIK